MASAFPFSEDEPFSQKVKCFADEELLEIWDESQQIENLFLAAIPMGEVITTDYEQAIVNELFLRASRKLCPAPKNS